MIFTFLILLFTKSLHPLHVSVTEIKFDPKDKELEITSRIFIDELEEAIRSERKQPRLDITSPGQGITTDQLLSEYLIPKLRLKLDGKWAPIKYLGHEVEGDAIIVYAYVSGVKKIKNVELTNTTITELYEDQSNLIHFTVNEKTKSVRLMRSSPSDKLSFE